MSHIIPQIYLGYEDEQIIENSKIFEKFNTNKIGGIPNWPLENCAYISKCIICGLTKVLVLQCYAPLEDSQYHRTLYLFACLNPTCWNRSEGWECVRSQLPDTNYLTPSCTTTTSVAVPKVETNLSWCGGADDWGDEEDTINGNVMKTECQLVANCTENLQESPDEMMKPMEEVQNKFDLLNVTGDNQNVSNNEVSINTPVAKIECNEDSGPILVDSPTSNQLDLRCLLNQKQELSDELRKILQAGAFSFAPKYISVELEHTKKLSSQPDDKVAKLINKYKKEHDDDFSQIPQNSCGKANKNISVGDEEYYEEAIPCHGDRLFHQFYNRLRENPEQILRYSRNSSPLLGGPIDLRKNDEEKLKKCERCNGPRICEIQLVPRFADSLESEYLLPDLNFLSVLVYTCSQSCWDNSDVLVKEMVVFQAEII